MGAPVGTTIDRTGTRRLSADEFRDVIGHFASGVTVITVEHDDKRYGSTASAVSSLSLEPPMVLICMSRESSTGQAIAAAGRFAINILTDEQDELAQQFAKKSPDKFHGVSAKAGPRGQPLLTDALATMECEVAEDVSGGTHTVFLGEVQSATSNEGSPLAYFRGEFGRLELSRDRQIYELLRERLLERKLPVGRELRHSELAEGMRVPRGALYYALGHLSAEGMLIRSKSGGFIVPPVTVEVLDDAVDATCAIELGAIDMSFGRVGIRDLERFKEALNATLMHVEPGRYIDLDTSIDANTRFHETLVRFAGSEPLLAAHRRVGLAGILARAFEPRISSTETDVGYGHDHRDIFDAFAQGDGEGARRAVLKHGDRIKKAFRAGVSEGGDPA